MLQGWVELAVVVGPVAADAVRGRVVSVGRLLLLLSPAARVGLLLLLLGGAKGRPGKGWSASMRWRTLAEVQTLELVVGCDRSAAAWENLTLQLTSACEIKKGNATRIQNSEPI